MVSSRLPASEVVRLAENSVERALRLREQAKLLLAEADQIEASARELAIELLGPEKGPIAYSMALWSTEATVSPATPPTATETAAASSRERAARTASNVQGATHITPSRPSEVQDAAPKAPAPEDRTVAVSEPQPVIRSEMFGIDVPPSRVEEADEIVEQVKAAISQGRKANPFANDRGKNAWRKSLYNAAFSELSAKAKTASTAPETPRPSEPAVRSAVDFDLEDLDMEESEAADIPAEILDKHEMDVVGDLPEADDQVFDGDFSDEDEGIVDTTPVPDTFHASEIPEDMVSDPLDDLDDDVLGRGHFPEPRSEFDPFDEIGDELPPQSSAPPPRSYQTNADTGEGSHKQSAPVAPKTPPPARAAVLPRPQPDPAGAHSVRGTVPIPAARPVEKQSVMHVPQPITDRRPGSGQVIQQPSTLLAATGSQPPVFKTPPPAARPPVSRQPPAFMKR